MSDAPPPAAESDTKPEGSASTSTSEPITIRVRDQVSNVSA